MSQKTLKVQREAKYRIWGSVPQAVGDEIDHWYVKMGIPKTAFISLCVQAGLKAVVRGVYPEEAFTPEQWQKILDVKGKTEGDIEKKA
jgi:hypothetical protein